MYSNLITTTEKNNKILLDNLFYNTYLDKYNLSNLLFKENYLNNVDLENFKKIQIYIFDENDFISRFVFVDHHKIYDNLYKIRKNIFNKIINFIRYKLHLNDNEYYLLEQNIENQTIYSLLIKFRYYNKFLKNLNNYKIDKNNRR